MCDQVAVIYDGRLVEQGPGEPSWLGPARPVRWWLTRPTSPRGRWRCSRRGPPGPTVPTRCWSKRPTGREVNQVLGRAGIWADQIPSSGPALEETFLEVTGGHGRPLMRLLARELGKLARPLTWGVAAPPRCSACCWPWAAPTTRCWKARPRSATCPRAPSSGSRPGRSARAPGRGSAPGWPRSAPSPPGRRAATPVAAGAEPAGLMASLPGALAIALLAGGHIGGEWSGRTMKNLLTQHRQALAGAGRQAGQPVAGRGGRPGRLLAGAGRHRAGAQPAGPPARAAPAAVPGGVRWPRPRWAGRCWCWPCSPRSACSARR